MARIVHHVGVFGSFWTSSSVVGKPFAECLCKRHGLACKLSVDLHGNVCSAICSRSRGDGLTRSTGKQFEHCYRILCLHGSVEHVRIGRKEIVL